MIKHLISAAALAAATLLVFPVLAQAQTQTSTRYAMVDDGYSDGRYNDDREDGYRDGRDYRDHDDNRRSHRNDGNVVRCESIGNRRAFCAADGSSRVRIVRQLSSSACIQGETWGHNRRNIWVSNGCRADFRLNR